LTARCRTGSLTPGPKMAGDVVHQAFPLAIVHHVADQGADLRRGLLAL
jgi:hypothetical protein